MRTLRDELVKLAHAVPETRKALLPILRNAGKVKPMRADKVAAFNVYGGGGKPLEIQADLRLRGLGGRLSIVASNAKWAKAECKKLLDAIGKAEGGSFRVGLTEITVESDVDTEMLVFRTLADTMVRWGETDHLSGPPVGPLDRSPDLRVFEHLLKDVCKKHGFLLVGVQKW